MCLKYKLYRVVNALHRQEFIFTLDNSDRLELEQHFTIDIVPIRVGIYIPLMGSVSPSTNVYAKAFGRLTSQ